MSVVRGATVLVLALVVACGNPDSTQSTGPEPPTITPPAPPPPPPPGPPPLSGPSNTFVFARELRYPVRDYTRESRFVLYDNGVVALQYIGLAFEYRGVYTYTNGVFAFHFGGNWDAHGEISGDVLTVRYGDFMLHSDFEDAVYALVK